MAAVYDAAKVGALGGVLAEELLDRHLHLLRELLRHVLMHKNVCEENRRASVLRITHKRPKKRTVRSDAHLARVAELATVQVSRVCACVCERVSTHNRMRRTATSMSISRSTMVGDLPPSSSVTGTRFSAAAFMTTRPMAVEPV